ncbi:MAG: hypothetical protein LBB08_00715 [Rickettsiales bacterium]|jgi:hypothetical protein|nr:hypothetical protein [Rickettsiales bacterium]
MIDYKKLFSEVLLTHKDDSKWIGALFGGIKIVSNTKVGEVGQDFIEKFCSFMKIDFEFPHKDDGRRLNQNPWDIKINGIKFELKTATEDTNKNFQFNHIRYHRPYDAVLCLGVAPDNLFFGIWTKSEIATGRAGNLVSMEKGANASYKLTKNQKTLASFDDFYGEIIKFTKNYYMISPK